MVIEKHFINPSLDGTYYGMALSICLSICQLCNDSKNAFFDYSIFGHKVCWDIFADAIEN